MQSVVQTGCSLYLLKRCLLQIQVLVAVGSHTQGVLHMHGEELFKVEYDRLVHFFLFEEMKRMSGIDNRQNPFQKDQHRVELPWEWEQV